MKRSSLRTKLLTGGILIVLIPLLVVGIFSAYKSSTALQEISLEQSVNVAKNLSAMVQMTLAEEIKMLTAFSVDPAFIDATGGNSDLAAAKLTEMMKKIGGEYEVLFVADATGLIKADGIGGSYNGINIGERDYFVTAKAGKANVGTVIKSKKTGYPVAVVAAPVYKDGNFSGIIAAAMKVDTLIEKISSIKIGKTGYAFMTDKTGLVIAHPKKEFVLELNMRNIQGMENITKRMLAFETASDHYVFKGVNKIAGFAPVEISSWAIGVTQDEAEFLGAAHAIRNVIFIFAGVFLLLTVVGVLYFARGITLPIGKATAELTEASTQVAAASSQVATASQSLAEGASEQASALEETSSSLEEMSSMTKQNAGNASQADSLMKQANSVVKRANDSMAELTRSMGDISAASMETSKIIKTIDEIAFQTNLLALNAAVEAARAGEAGAGFAVVAEEVRNLAMRAAEAAKNTSALIETTVIKIKDGSNLVSKTNEAFLEVAASASKVGELVGEISAASNEQAQGIDQITKAVAEMDKVTQETAASAEESASASEEMNAQAEQMKHVTAELTNIIGGNTEHMHSAASGAAGARTSGLRKVLRLTGASGKDKSPAHHSSAMKGRQVTKHSSIDDSNFSDF
ncbi:MAG: methyl-accepting chemotaxis protein [Deltaproteobacteria bacterium]|nr:methyl-accepting chemotaxis protein [Deltaproteobacteria bacterium]